MVYRPITGVWEITMGNNVRGGHYGSFYSDPLPDELTTAEAFDLIEQIAYLGLRYVTLSGGEPLTRRDWAQLVNYLTRRGVSVNLITNGWAVTEEVAKQMKNCNISTVVVRVDGTREVHDRILRPGVYDRVEQAFRILRQHDIDTRAITTLSVENKDILPQMKDELIRMGVSSWQLSLGLPTEMMGGRREDWMLNPSQMDDILRFCTETNNEGNIEVYPANCLDCHSRNRFGKRFSSAGCEAGTGGLGFLYNGDIVSCVSIKDRNYIEGNIRERDLQSIWEDESKFLWRREMTNEKLSGDCQVCQYGSECLGGCPNTRLVIGRNLYGENPYCSHNFAVKTERKRISELNDATELMASAKALIEEHKYQKATMYLDRLIELRQDNPEAYRLKGFIEYQNGNYEQSEESMVQALSLDPSDSHATKVLGMAVFKQGKRTEGIRLVERSLQMGEATAQEELKALKYEKENNRPYPRRQPLQQNRVEKELFVRF
ncbi:MAG: radical SAM protein [Rikenellaceae bacterium]|jgi:radical SAM protein with 4Fe4S-binding SPASM domain|nr:radical SAM protein [Rikenellaceae bacterium]